MIQEGYWDRYDDVYDPLVDDAEEDREGGLMEANEQQQCLCPLCGVTPQKNDAEREARKIISRIRQWRAGR
jgi:rubredoxin